MYSTYWPADEDYYANGEQYTPAVKENVAITKEQWADVEQIVLELYPQLEEIPEKRDHYNIPLPGVHVVCARVAPADGIAGPKRSGVAHRACHC